MGGENSRGYIGGLIDLRAFALNAFKEGGWVGGENLRGYIEGLSDPRAFALNVCKEWAGRTSS